MGMSRYKIHHGFVFYTDNPEYELVHAISDHIYNQKISQNVKLIRKHRNREVYRFIHDSKVYYIKKFYGENRKEKIRNILFNKSFHSYYISKWMNSYDIGVVKSILVIVYGLPYQNLFVMEESEGVSLVEVFRSDISQELKAIISEEFLKSYDAVCKKGFIQIDPILSNFFVRKDEDGGIRFEYIDVDSFVRVFLGKKYFRRRSFEKIKNEMSLVLKN